MAGKEAACDSRARQLYVTMEHIQMQNEILRNENNSLKSALIEEKRKRRRQKPLKSYLRDEDDQVAVVFAPNKIKLCRQRMEEVEEQRQQEEARKQEEKLQRDILAQEKAIAAKRKKLQALQRKQAAQAARDTKQANQQLHHDARGQVQRAEKSIRQKKQQK